MATAAAHRDSHKAADMSAPVEGRTRAMLAWFWQHKIAAAVAGILALVFAVVTPAMVMMRLVDDAAAKPTSLAAALSALDERKLQLAYDLAIRLKTQEGMPADALGGPAFILGAVLAYDAELRGEDPSIDNNLLAARQLEEARDFGFPKGHEAEGLFLLGRSQFLSKQLAASAATLEAAMAADPKRATESHRMLAHSYAGREEPDLEKALSHNGAYLADPLQVGPIHDEELLFRAELLERLGRNEEARAALAQLPEQSTLRPAMLCLKAQMEIDTAKAQLDKAKPDERKELLAKLSPQLEEAIVTLREAQQADSLGTATTRRCMYLVGVAEATLGRAEEAFDQCDRARKLHHDSTEGMAASLLASQLLEGLGRDDEAIESYQQTLSMAPPPAIYVNSWVSLVSLRSAMMSTYDHYLSKGDYERVLELLKSFSPLFTQVRTTELKAAVYRDWGERLLRQVANATSTQALSQRQLAAERFRQAGATYARLASLRLATREYPKDIWNAADNYLAGYSYPEAIANYKTYLTYELRLRRPQALTNLGRAYLALGKLADAVDVLEECIEFYPDDATTYSARLWCSKAYQDLGNMAAAEKLLVANLTSATLTPQSLEWRDSLFALGNLLYVDGRFSDSIAKLEEAVARYPDTSQAWEARYLIARAHHEAAREPLEKLRSETIESVRAVHRREVKQHLEAALANYTDVQTVLLRRGESNELTLPEIAILRNSYFFIGSVLFDLGRYEEAITAYSDTSTRYQNDPLVLEALVRIFDCHRRLNRPIEARGALEQAKVLWNRLPESANFTGATSYTRDEWIRMLESMSSW